VRTTFAIFVLLLVVASGCFDTRGSHPTDDDGDGGPSTDSGDSEKSTTSRDAQAEGTVYPGSVCGNDKREYGEVCDGADLGGLTCESLSNDQMTGTLRCNTDCNNYDESLCYQPTPSGVCGNDKREYGEVCDGLDLGGATCASLFGYQATGTLSCRSDCKTYDDSMCSNNPTPSGICGNNKKEGTEACDGTDLGGATCASLYNNQATGVLRCNPDCKNYDESMCLYNPNYGGICGNNKKESTEVCDGVDLDGATCASLFGYQSTGTLSCRSDCKSYDTGMCH
jgi:hypothetical protein